MTFPPVIAADKANHFVYGAIIYDVAFVLATMAGFMPWARLFGLASAAAFGIGKEASDALLNYRTSGNWRIGPHGVEGTDALATVLGAAAAAVTSMVRGPAWGPT